MSCKDLATSSLDVTVTHHIARELEEAQVSLGIMQRARATAEARVGELSEQQKLLVRELKASTPS